MKMDDGGMQYWQQVGQMEQLKQEMIEQHNKLMRDETIEAEYNEYLDNLNEEKQDENKRDNH
jgi:hypothetical protein